MFRPLSPLAEGTWTCPVCGPRAIPQVEDLKCMWIKDRGNSENRQMRAEWIWAGPHQCLLHVVLWVGTEYRLAWGRTPHSVSAKTPLSGPMTHVTCLGKISSNLPSKLD